MRLAYLIAALLALPVLAGCGDDDEQPATVTVTTTVTTTVPAGPSAEADELAQQLRDLQEEIAATGRSLIEDPDANREQARERLERHVERARELGGEARSLPEAEAAREALVEAADRTTQAARDLRVFVEENDDQALERARDALRMSEDELRRAAQELLERAPADARRALEEAMENLPDLPSSAAGSQP